ncbi:hypothetical protein IKF73_01910 [Candidatus Saccharibacteria bacterium]|nr:hypothetical protein [Candidatus Saccharibacteria bacterium]
MSSRKKRRFSSPQIIIIVIIGASMVAVIIATICSLIFKPENLVKAQISALATDYYENYLYPSFDQNSPNFNDFMQKYETTGLTITTLRQILLHDHQKNVTAAPFLKEHCDENSTFIKFYPEYPYSKTSYHVEYSYSCDF